MLYTCIHAELTVYNKLCFIIIIIIIIIFPVLAVLLSQYGTTVSVVVPQAMSVSPHASLVPVVSSLLVFMLRMLL